MKIVHEEIKEPNYGWTPDGLHNPTRQQNSNYIENSRTSLSEHDTQFKKHRFKPRELESSFTSFKIVNPEAIDATEARTFSLVITLHDATILHVSNSIMDALGFPKDMLNGQCLLNYLYPRDKPTFSNYLSQALQSRFAINQSKRDKFTFYVRFREYMTLRKGFGIVNRKATYKPFQLTCTTRDVLMGNVLPKQRKHSSVFEKHEFLKDFIANEDKNEKCATKNGCEVNQDDEEACNMSQTVCLVINASSVDSVYQVPNEVSPAMTPFTTRHTSSCHFSYVDSSAVSYLGYLPQDLIGYSVFDFYKSEDFELLREVYEALTHENSQIFRSTPYSFKAFNGDYVSLETDWSCFTNPWSKKIEFVVGQHRILCGPTNPDVFKEPQCLNNKTQVLNDSHENVHKFQEEIKTLLNAPIKKCKSSTTEQDKRRKRKLAIFVSNIIDGIGNKDEASSAPTQCTVSLDSPPVEESSITEYCQVQESDQENRLMDNIERFFRSNPKSNCPPSERNSSSNENSGPDGDSNESSESNSNLQSNRPLTNADNKKDEQFSSESDPGHKIGKKNSKALKPTISLSTTSNCLPLTEDVLHLHEKVALKEYMKVSASTRPNIAKLVSPTKENPNKLKRTITPDTLKHQKKHQKVQKNEKFKQIKYRDEEDEKNHRKTITFVDANGRESSNPPLSFVIQLSLAQPPNLCPSYHNIGASPQLFMPIIPVVLGAEFLQENETGNELQDQPVKTLDKLETDKPKRSIEVQTDGFLPTKCDINNKSISSASSSAINMNLGSSSGSGNEMIVSSSSDSDGLRQKHSFSGHKDEKRNSKSVDIPDCDSSCDSSQKQKG